MAEITKIAIASLASLLPNGTDILSGNFYAGEDLAVFDACYIKPSDGKIYRSIGTALGADAAKVRGYTPETVKAGNAVTLYKNVRATIGAGLTPGKNVYLSGTVAGGLADAASTGGINPIGFTVDGTRIQLNASNY